MGSGTRSGKEHPYATDVYATRLLPAARRAGRAGRGGLGITSAIFRILILYKR